MGQGERKPVTRSEMERAARVYRTNKDAARSLGIAIDTFTRLCREYGIEMPYQREMRRRSEWAKGYNGRK